MNLSITNLLKLLLHFVKAKFQGLIFMWKISSHSNTLWPSHKPQRTGVYNGQSQPFSQELNSLAFRNRVALRVSWQHVEM